MIRALVVATLLAGALAPAADGRTTRIAGGTAVSGLTAYGGHLVFSRRDPATRRWRLWHWHAGRLTALPVASRAVAFDADAGPDPAGHPVVDFSQCTTDPRPGYAAAWTRARGCTLRELRLDLQGARPHLLPAIAAPGTSLTTPSRWRGSLAYVAHPDGGFVSTVLLTRGAGAPEPLAPAKPSCEIDCDDRRVTTTVEALDLGAHAAAFVQRQEGADTIGIASEWQLRVDPLDGPVRPRTLVYGFIDGACGYVQPYAPTALGTGVFWVAAGSPCSDTQSAFAATDLATGRRTVAAAPGGGVVLDATRDGPTTYWLRATGPVGDTGPGPLACTGRLRCTVVRTAPLVLRPLRKGQTQGPVPEDGR